MKKLVQTGEDNEGVFNVMDGLSFVRAINDNATALGTETKLDLEIYNTPEAIAKALKEQTGKIGFHTPGGPDDLPTFEEKGAPVDSPSEQKGGVAQIYNEALGDTTKSIAITTPPDKTTYYEGEELDLTGMVVTATEEDGDTKEVTDYTVNITEPLTTADTEFIVNYNGKTATQAITVNEDLISSIIVDTPPTKVEYTEGETFDPTGLVVKVVYDSGSSAVVNNEDLTFNPTTDTPLTTSDTLVTISYNELNCTQSITVNEA